MRISDWSSDVCSSDLALSAHSYQARKKNELDAFRLIRRDCPTFGRPGPETFVQNLAPCFGSAGRCPLLRQLGWVPIGCGSSSELLASSLRPTRGCRVCLAPIRAALALAIVTGLRLASVIRLRYGMPSFGGSHGRSHGDPSGQEVPGDSKGEPRHQAHRGPSAIPCCRGREGAGPEAPGRLQEGRDRKSTRLNSSP